ncbi:phage baseplate protein [Enterobacter hormaechei]|uniref:phage baseplate protein n=1 Tax=Enterobacter hormaechei TaxID=158836 RepID=UPI003076589E
MAVNNNFISPAQQAQADKRARDAAAAKRKQDTEVSNAKSREDIQYTMFVSGLRRGRLNEFESKNQTDDLAILFDSVTNHTYTKDYNKSSYAVESKAKASDHVTTQDGKFTFSGTVTDSPYLIDPRNMIDRDTDKDNPMLARRPAKAIEILELIADSHQLVTLVTEDNILTNYVITNFQIDRNDQTGSSIGVQVTLEEFRFKNANKTVLARTADPKKAGNANSGTKQTADGGAVDDSAKQKRQTPYIGKNAAAKERFENARIGTTDFSGKPGAKLPFDPNSLKRP